MDGAPDVVTDAAVDIVTDAAVDIASDGALAWESVDPISDDGQVIVERVS